MQSAMWVRLPKMYVDLWDDRHELEENVKKASRIINISIHGKYENYSYDYRALYEDISNIENSSNKTFIVKMHKIFEKRAEISDIPQSNYINSLILNYVYMNERLNNTQNDFSNKLWDGGSVELIDMIKLCEEKIEFLKYTRTDLTASGDWRSFPKKKATDEGRLWRKADRLLMDSLSHVVISESMYGPNGSLKGTGENNSYAPNK
jgi:hypothetical protein